MSIETSAFTSWISQFSSDGKPPRLRELYSASGVPVATLSVQRARDKVTPKTILAIARGYGRDAPMELASFSGYEALKVRPAQWGPEVLSLFHVAELVKELQVRAHLLEDTRPHLEVPAMNALARWEQYIAGGQKRADTAVMLGFSRTAYSAALYKPSLAFEQILTLAEHFGASPYPGLVAGGHLLPEELGGQPVVSDILRLTSARTLLEEVQRSYRYLVDSLEAAAVDEELRWNLR